LLRRGVFFGLLHYVKKNGEKVDLAEKKIWRRWPANAARFFQIWRKSEKSLSVHKSGLAELIR